jgi:hypothetical protein
VVGQLLWGLVAIRHFCGIAWLRGKVSGLRMARQWRSEDRKVPAGTLRAIIEASERDIYDLQQQTGFDGYWRAYFWLLRR